MAIVAIALLIAVLLAVSYLITVGLTWLVLTLVNAIWHLGLDWNVWLLGLLAWVVFWILRSIFKHSSKD